MIAALAALLLAAQPPGEDLGPRIADSAAAAQALQGELDGTWVLWDGRGRTLFVLQITDPPGGQGPLEAAWRGPKAGSPMGLVTRIEHVGNQLFLEFATGDDTAVTRFRLVRRPGMGWRGVCSGPHGQQRVRLARQG